MKFILNPQFSILNPVPLLLTAVMFLTACGPGAEPPNGRELYLAYGCAACHGQDADGNGPSASLSVVKPRDLRSLHLYSGPKTPEGIAATIAMGVANGVTGMPGYPDIPQRERRAIAEYLVTLASVPRGVTADAAWAGESNPWKMAAVYMSLSNPTPKPVALIGASTDAAQTVEMHEMVLSDGASMHKLERIVVPPNGTVRLPSDHGGKHLMLIGLNRDLRDGDSVVLTLRFDDGSERTVTVPVRAPSAATEETGTTGGTPESRATGAYTLLDQDRRVFQSSSLKGRPALLFFGYTHCPDACPMTMAKLARAYRLAGPAAKDIPTLFVSVDPRDTPEVLREYLSYFSAIPARGLTGTKAQIDAVVRQFGARYEIHDRGSAAGALVDHTLSIHLLDRNGRVVQKFNPATVDPREIAKALRDV